MSSASAPASASSSSSSSSASPIIKYVPFQSKADPSFWMKLGDHKLNTLRLTQDPIDIRGSFTLHSTIVHRDTSKSTSNDAKGLVKRGGNANVNVNAKTNANAAAAYIPGRMRFDQDSIDVDISSTVDDTHTKRTTTTITTTTNENVATHGKIQILNTLESFKTTNKNELLNKYCLGNLLNACGVTDSDNEGDNDNVGDTDESINALTSFYCLCHLDLKAHKVLYWFAFPVLTPSPGHSIRYAEKVDTDLSLSPQCTLKRAWGQDRMEALQKGIHALRVQCLKSSNMDTSFPPYFIVVPIENGNADTDTKAVTYKCLQLSFENYESLSEQEKQECTFAFLDATNTDTSKPNDDTADDTDTDTATATSIEPVPVGWTLRNLIAYMTLKLGCTGVIPIISYRPSVIRRIDTNIDANVDVNVNVNVKNDSSLLLQVQLPSKDDYKWPAKTTTTTTSSSSSSSPPYKYTCMGWELNARSKPGPRSINLAPLLSPSHLAQQATDLNLKLMKWRMIPNLDLEQLSSLKVCLLGAGTLGCSVARTLLGWGVRNFVFVDNGKVSYSNPVRQNLFDLVDCEKGGKDKAIAAADALKRIAGPSIESKGYVLTIPMPGHAFSEKEAEGVKKDTTLMQQLIDDADVVFLLTDTRESRWLPTVMARASNKMLINAALGLDSWLVMRHGGNIEDGRLGCYFCNDVVAPENSTKNRTLDQQCTVTRPGLAAIASSMAVELMVALLHHEGKQNAPAPPATKSVSSYSPTVATGDKESSPLGLMPHQIRGSIVTYTMMTPTVPAFRCCTGCSDPIINAYKEGLFDFIRKACCHTDASYLEDIAGLTKFRDDAATMMEDCVDWDEADSDDEF